MTRRQILQTLIKIQKMEGLGTAYNVKVRHTKAPISKSSTYTNVSNMCLKKVQLIHICVLLIHLG